jgi:uncharacterized membrane protein (UPF0136 family)
MDKRVYRNSIISGLIFGALLGFFTHNWVIGLVGGVLFACVLAVIISVVTRKTGTTKE